MILHHLVSDFIVTYHSKRGRGKLQHLIFHMIYLCLILVYTSNLPTFQIWSSIESSQNLQATQLYLLACHIVSSLQLDSSTQQSAQLLAWFPLLSRQWTAISHFKGGILQSCRNILKNANVSDQVSVAPQVVPSIKGHHSCDEDFKAAECTKGSELFLMYKPKMRYV